MGGKILLRYVLHAIHSRQCGWLHQRRKHGAPRRLRAQRSTVDHRGARPFTHHARPPWYAKPVGKHKILLRLRGKFLFCSRTCSSSAMTASPWPRSAIRRAVAAAVRTSTFSVLPARGGSRWMMIYVSMGSSCVTKSMPDTLRWFVARSGGVGARVLVRAVILSRERPMFGSRGTHACGRTSPATAVIFGPKYPAPTSISVYLARV